MCMHACNVEGDMLSFRPTPVAPFKTITCATNIYIKLLATQDKIYSLHVKNHAIGC